MILNWLHEVKCRFSNCVTAFTFFGYHSFIKRAFLLSPDLSWYLPPISSLWTYEFFYSTHYNQLSSFLLMCHLYQASLCTFLFNEPISLCALTCFLTSDFSGLSYKFPVLGLEIAISLRSTLPVISVQKPGSRCQVYSMLPKWICLKLFQGSELGSVYVCSWYLSICIHI